MKKILALLSIAFLLATSVNAQLQNQNIPRTGNLPGQDNTYRVLNYTYDSLPPDEAGLDTLYVTPIAFHTQVWISTVTDSFALEVSNTNYSYKGDELEVQGVNSSAGTVVRFAGPYLSTATVTKGSQHGALYLTASKLFTIIFHFNGTTWVEVSRMAQ